ncbi:MAG: type II toxin-antitoxin system HicA family toxin [Pseudomonadota bacterium]
MKRRDFLRHLLDHGCRFVREGAEHSIWEDPATNRRASIPRHSEIPEFTAARISKHLGVPIYSFNPVPFVEQAGESHDTRSMSSPPGAQGRGTMRPAVEADGSLRP